MLSDNFRPAWTDRPSQELRKTPRIVQTAQFRHSDAFDKGRRQLTAQQACLRVGGIGMANVQPSVRDEGVKGAIEHSCAFVKDRWIAGEEAAVREYVRQFQPSDLRQFGRDGRI